MGEARPRGRGDLRAQLTRFFGREQERAALTTVIGEARLVTVVGPPGCGKTRLAIETEQDAAGAFPDGVWFVDLATVTGSGSVAEAVATALGIRGAPGQTMVDAAVEALREAAPLLVILDNCEHVVSAAASLLQSLLSACPSVQVLATSRTPLGVPGERVWNLPPLDLSTATELFADRAELAGGPTVTLDPTTRPEVEAICTLLACLPLGIELVAASSRILSLTQIADRLAGNLPLVADPGRGRSTRHETMDATIDWSYQLLPPRAQQLLIHLSVFAGSFDLDGIEAVADDRGGAVLGALDTLVRHSLVTTEPDGSDPMRYRLLEPIRQWAATRLAATEDADDVHRRHADHYLIVFNQFDPFGSRMIRGELQRPVPLEKVARDEANMLAALEWARTQPDELLIQLCLPLTDYWYFGGRANEGRAWFEEALARKLVDQRLRARLLLGAGTVFTKTGDYDRAGELLAESQRLYEQQEADPLVRAGTVSLLNVLATLNLSQGNNEQAMAYSRASISRARAIGHTLGQSFATIVLAWAHMVAGDVAAAVTLFEEVVELSASFGPRAATARAMAHHGVAYLAAFVTDEPTLLRTHLAGTLDALGEGGLVERGDVLIAGTALAASEGRYEAAARIVGGVNASNGHRGAEPPQRLRVMAEPVVDRVAEAIGQTRADRLVAEGARMTWDQLTVEVLAQPGDREQLLTRREREVADLVAQGLNNTEIAEALYISRRTVETHVDNIKRKLGLTARHQLLD